jgi:UDP-GlcNAc:undecaprenyl-phosphate GlcNAc-1-phosphate transferase
MGDGGAYFLGFLIGLVSLANSHKGSVAAALIAPLFALTLPIVDVGMAILRRGLKGLPIFRPDRKHIHHALLNFGFSRERAVLLLYTFSVASLFLAFGVFWSQGRLLPLLAGFLFLLVAITARSVGLVKGWFSVKSRLSKSLALRIETRYALTLCQWLELESERRHSILELWEDFQFVVKKLGFSEARLALAEDTRSWQTQGFDRHTHPLRQSHFDVNGCGKLDLAADPQVMPEKVFELLSDLAAESWHKAATRWTKLNQIPIRFDAYASPDTTTFQRNQPRPYSPDTAELWVRNRGLKAQST